MKKLTLKEEFRYAVLSAIHDEGLDISEAIDSAFEAVIQPRLETPTYPRPITVTHSAKTFMSSISDLLFAGGARPGRRTPGRRTPAGGLSHGARRRFL
jgi:hypothetical protein